MDLNVVRQTRLRLADTGLPADYQHSSVPLSERSQHDLEVAPEIAPRGIGSHLTARVFLGILLVVLVSACGARSKNVTTASPPVPSLQQLYDVPSEKLVPLDPFPPLKEGLEVYQGLGSAPVTKDLQHARDLAYVRAHRDLIQNIMTAYETRFGEGADRALVTNVITSRGILVGQKITQAGRLDDTIYVRIAIPTEQVNQKLLPIFEEIAKDVLSNDVRQKIQQDINDSNGRLREQLRLLNEAQREWNSSK